MGSRRHRGRRPAGKDQHQVATRCEARGRAEGKVDFRAARGWRNRWLYCAAPAVAAQGHAECRLAVSRPCRRRQGLLQAHGHFSDHASGRRAAHFGREAPLAARGGLQSLRAGQESCARPIKRYFGNESDLAVHRGAAFGSARVDGRGLLVLWRCREPQDAGHVPASPSFTRFVAAPGDGRRRCSTPARSRPSSFRTLQWPQFAS